MLINRFLDFQRKRCRTAQLSKKDLERQEGIIAKHLIPFFGKMKLANIQPTNVYAYVEARTGEVSAATIAKECAVLKRFLTVASTNWNLISKNPTRGVEMPELPGGRTRHLAPAELQKLLVACPAWLRPIAGLAVSNWMPSRRTDAHSLGGCGYPTRPHTARADEERRATLRLSEPTIQAGTSTGSNGANPKTCSFLESPRGR